MLADCAYSYQVYDLNIASELEIKELKPGNGSSRVDLTIRFAELGLLGPDTEPGFSFSAERQVIILPIVGAFVLDGIDTVWIERSPGVTDDFLAVPLLGPVLAIALHLRRKFILHGSAVILDGKAYGFVGDKGAGKSTLAAMLLKNRDVEFLTDDLLVISNGLQALRGYPQMKLSDEALKHADQQLGSARPPPIDKFPKNQFLLKEGISHEAVPVGGIFELRRAPVARIEDLNLQEAIRLLLRYSYMARFDERPMSAIEKHDMFSVTTRLASSCVVRRLYVPERIEELDQMLGTLRSIE